MPNQRPLIVAGLLVAALACATFTLAGMTLLDFHNAADYPGGLLVSAHNIYEVSPHISVRRDTSYRTHDDFPQVYHWYSRGFDLGPEARAQSACIYMQRAKTRFVVEQHMGVMICDTPTGRMMFVERSLAFRFRR